MLYTVRDLASSTGNERNLKNAKILQSNIFSKDLCLIAKYALKLFEIERHNF
jgi:hypothetical protein